MGVVVDEGRKSDGITPLFFASQNGHLAIVESLVRDGGALVDKTMVDGTTIYVGVLQHTRGVVGGVVRRLVVVRRAC